MSSTAPKNMFHVMFIHKVPPGLSKDEFEFQLESLVDGMVQLPVVKKNLVKLDLIIQNEKVDEHTPKFGFQTREHVVFVAAQSETQEQFFEVLADPEVRKLVEKGKEFGLHSSTYAFSADVDAKIDNPAPEGNAHMICVYNVPSDTSDEKHDNTYHEWLENTFIRVPAVKKHFVRLEVWQSNNVLDDHIRAFGYSPAGPLFWHHARLDSWDSTFEMMTDSDAHNSVLESGNDGKDFALRQNGYVCACHVVTKLDKSV
ncbi:hypothetical protein GGX14DRAFT_582910 [Mycena pura]|uniref:EthD domain-containing protein n=1 Tax=Mycena pura TaxID=153505 RepID=A0AAD6YVI0_9AGAR|nr:hypothetical protein GGX14DRAFT_582910 [Mycena pura]